MAEDLGPQNKLGMFNYPYQRTQNFDNLLCKTAATLESSRN